MEESWPRLVAGESGIARISAFDPQEAGLTVHIAGEVKGFDPTNYMDARAARRMDRFCQLGIAATVQALRDSGLKITDANRDEIAVFYSTGAGGLHTIITQEHVRLTKGPQRVSPLAVPMLMANAVAGQIGIQFGARGIGGSFASACASSNDALGLALAAIQLGWVSAAIAGGTEAPILPLAVASFAQAGALSTHFNHAPEQASRPFDARREGFVLSEIATTLIIEEYEQAHRRGAHIWAELLGYGASMDSYHITAPAPDGDGAARAMRAALRNAGLKPEEIDYINAHGTSTPLNDRIETLAIKAVFGEHAYRIPISAVKSMVGHSAGACGAFEAAVCAYAFQKGSIPPTINYVYPDPECDLDYVPNVARRMAIRTALSNNFGFGGHNSCVVLARVD